MPLGRHYESVIDAFLNSGASPDSVQRDDSNDG